MKLSIELDIEIEYEDIEDEGDDLTAPYSATRIDYDTDYVLRQVEVKLREELHYARTQRRPEPMSPAEWAKETRWGLQISDQVAEVMKLYAQYYSIYR